MIELCIEDARGMAARAQLLGGECGTGAEEVLGRLGAVQIDSISVGARSHALVLGARGVPPREHGSYFTGTGGTFEYWAHASCVLPVELWPAMAFRRRRMRDKARDWDTDERLFKTILRRLDDEGPLTVSDFEDEEAAPRRGGWDWGRVKQAFECLLFTGEVACTRRSAWRRVYDLPERVIPAHLLTDTWTDEACLLHLVQRAGKALGVATRDDIADYYRLRPTDVRAVLAEAELAQVTVQGWDQPAFAASEVLDRGAATGSVTALLSPFDSMVWHRPRVQQLFGVDYVFEAYKPPRDRRYGYYVMPLLHEAAVVALVDVRTARGTLHARLAAELDPRAREALDVALVDLARTVQAERVVVTR